MSSPLTDKAISELYQQRKKHVNAPNIDTKSPTQPKRNIKLFSHKILYILSASCFASFSIFALINHLKTPIKPAENNINFQLNSQLNLPPTNKATPQMQPSSMTIKEIPPLPQVIIPPKTLQIAATNSKIEVVNISNINTQLLKQNIKINAQVLSDKLNIVLIKKVQPKYPMKALQQNLEGTVDLNYQVNALGEVINIKVNHSTDKIFNNTSKKALKQWQFERFNEKEQNIYTQYSIVFTFTMHEN